MDKHTAVSAGVLTASMGRWADVSQRYASAVYALAVCPSMCPSQVGVLSKRRSASSRKQHRTI